MIDELAFTSAREIARRVATREISPVEVLEAFIRRFERVNPTLNAFCTVDLEDALRQARAAEAAVVHRDRLGPLHGVPVSIKDLIFTKGLRTTFGSAMHEHLVPDRDEIVVERLRNAGAIIVGKTNTCEFGYKAVTDNLLFGPTRNPWNIGLTPSGSSGGAGAAVAAGLGPIAIGSDGGGSVRCPASCCGVFGFKPSRGRVPIHPVLRGWETLDRRVAHIGPLTRSVADAALVMSVIAGADDRDASSIPRHHNPVTPDGNVAGARIAVSFGFNGAVVDPRVRGRVEAACRVFEHLGCNLELVDPGFSPMHGHYQRLFAADAAGSVGDLLSSWRERLDPGFVKVVELGLSMSAADYVTSQNAAHLMCRDLAEFFAPYDFILTPTLPIAPFPIGIDWPREVASRKVHPLNLLAYTYPLNLSGHPAASVPCGWADDGLPIGMQIVGKRFEDAAVLSAAAAFEIAAPWSESTPPP